MVPVQAVSCLLLQQHQQQHTADEFAVIAVTRCVSRVMMCQNVVHKRKLMFVVWSVESRK
jgi:hypothetical protein